MARLNQKTYDTERVIHILVTSICNRRCPHCCNNQYELNEIPYVTDDELNNAETICLTGGEPFLFSNPCEISRYYRGRYPNIQNVYVYTNAAELAFYLENGGRIHSIDGVNISIKTKEDVARFQSVIANNNEIKNLPGNRLYVFNGLYDGKANGFTVIKREWQTDFVPANDSIFRKA